MTWPLAVICIVTVICVTVIVCAGRLWTDEWLDNESLQRRRTRRWEKNHPDPGYKPGGYVQSFRQARATAR